MLIEQTLWGTIDKVQVAIDRIKTFEPPEGYYVAFSGGKDSVVILDLVKRSGVKFDAHYNITGIDAPESMASVPQPQQPSLRLSPLLPQQFPSGK